MTAILRSITTQPLDPDAPTGFDISVENATLAADLNDNNREVIAASARLWQINTLARLLPVDLNALAGRDDDGNAIGYTLNSTKFNGEPYSLREGLQLAIYVDTTNAAGAVIHCPGISGGTTRSEQSGALVSGLDGTALLVGALVPYRLYKVQWLPASRRWLVVGIETPLTQIRILAAVADEGIPWAKIDVPDGSIITDLIADNAIDGSKVKDGAIDTAQLANGAVRRNQIDAGTITGNKMADRTIGAGKIILGTLTADLFAAGAIPDPAISWTTEIITTTGSAVSHTITAKEVEIEIWGGGGSGARSRGSYGSNGATSTLAIGTETISLYGGRGGTAADGNFVAITHPTYPADPVITDLALLKVQGAGAGGGGGGGQRGSGNDSEDGGGGRSGDYLRAYISSTTASSRTLIFTLGAGVGSGGSAGAPARALLRYR